MDAGSAQELRLIQHLRTSGYTEIIHGEEAVKRMLGLPAGPGCKCADVLAFVPDKRKPAKAVLAESKGTEVAKAIKQLGNAAAAAIERYGTALDIELLLYRSELRVLDVGLSPGPGFLVEPGATPRDFTLIDATSAARSLARAKCDLGAPWSRWNPNLQLRPIRVFVEQV